MTSTRSLSHFFATAEDSSLDTCARERIHLSGRIQNIGAVLVLDPETQMVAGASENIVDFLGGDIDQILNSPLSKLAPVLACEIAGLPDDERILYEALEFETVVDGVTYDTVTHCHAGRRIVEFVPNASPSLKEIRTKLRRCGMACASIMHAADFDDAMEIAVQAVREISGASRVKIYKFLADWSGEVVAESSDGVLPSYLGLCFPASDIPEQVREIMSIVPYRAIGVTDKAPVPIRSFATGSEELDLTWSMLRSVSKMHIEYLKNIDVGAAFSCGLMSEGKLWGLIAVHNQQPGLLPFDFWNMIHEIGNALMLRFSQQERTDTASMIAKLRHVENGFAAALRKGNDFEIVIQNLVPVLQSFLNADGFAFQFGDNLHVAGRTPPRPFIRDLLNWAIEKRTASDQFQSLSLHKEWAPAADYIDVACGVLIQPIMVHRVCQLVWFRGPITRTVHWAGNPNEKSEGEILTPRKSFDTWVQQHKDQSAPWQTPELQSAREIFADFLDIIAEQLLLKEENATLRQFAATAAHDLRAPLIGLNMALDWMSEDDFDPESVRATHKIAQKSSRRMADLTESLLELAVLDEQEKISFETVDIRKTMEDIKHLLTAQIEEKSAELIVTELPEVFGNERLLLRLFMNLIANALKFSLPNRPPEIVIKTVSAAGGFVGLAVEDNGLGIDPKYAERIFQPMQRLHSKDEIEGTGLGLTICQRIVAAHGGSLALDVDYRDGARFVVMLPKRQGDAV